MDSLSSSHLFSFSLSLCFNTQMDFDHNYEMLIKTNDIWLLHDFIF